MSEKHIGKVIQVTGPVLDIRFKEGELPALLNAIEINIDGRRLIAEVAQQIGDDVVRCIAMSSTDGLVRGIDAVDTEGPITVPVGDECLGRVFNLLGDSLVGLLHSFSAAFGFQEITEKIVYLIRCSGVVSAAAAVLLILILYTLLPGGKQPLKEQIPGAVFTSLGWLVFTEVFTRFVPLFWKSSVYGSLASLFLTITWVKVSVMILFLGDALNAAWKEEHA